MKDSSNTLDFNFVEMGTKYDNINMSCTEQKELYYKDLMKKIQ